MRHGGSSHEEPPGLFDSFSFFVTTQQPQLGFSPHIDYG